MHYLHISRNIDRCLEKLRMTGSQGALAASQYLQILECIRQGKWRSDIIMQADEEWGVQVKKLC